MAKESPNDKILFQAKDLIERGEFEKLKKIFQDDQGLKDKINIPLYNGNTLLHIACQQSNAKDIEKIIDLLINNGANPEARNSYRLQTPTHVAADSSNSRAIMVLSYYNSDINAKVGLGDTALHHAAQKDNADAIEALVVFGGAQQYIKNSINMLPIDYAVRQRSFKAIEALINYYDIPSLFDNALEYAKKQKDEKLINALSFEPPYKLSEGYIQAADKIFAELEAQLDEQYSVIKKDPVEFGKFLNNLEFFYNHFAKHKTAILRSKNKIEEKMKFGNSMLALKIGLEIYKDDIVKAKQGGFKSGEAGAELPTNDNMNLTDWRVFVWLHYGDRADRIVKDIEYQIYIHTPAHLRKTLNLINDFDKISRDEEKKRRDEDERRAKQEVREMEVIYNHLMENDNKQSHVARLTSNNSSNINHGNQQQSFVQREESRNSRRNSESYVEREESSASEYEYSYDYA